MSSNKKYSELIKEKIEKHNFPYGEYSFYMLPRLMSIAEHLEKNEKTCDYCKNISTQLEDLCDNLPHYIHGSSDKRKEYEKICDGMVNHLRKTHKLVPKNHYISLFTALGIVSGAGIGIIISYSLNNEFNKAFLLIFMALGMVAGQISGIIKDKKLKKHNMVL